MKIKILFILILFFTSQILCQSSDWNILQPTGIGAFKHIEVKNDGSIYLLADMGLFKSNNEGLSWTELSDGRTKSFALCIDTNRIISGYNEPPNHYLNISEEEADTLKTISKHFLGSQTWNGGQLGSDLKINTYFINKDKSYVVVDYWDYQNYGKYYSNILYNNNQDTIWQKINYPEYMIYSLYCKDNNTIIVGNNHSTGNNSAYGWFATISFTFDGGTNWSYYPGLIWNGAEVTTSINSILVTNKNIILYSDSHGIFRLFNYRNTNYSNNYPSPWDHILSGTNIIKLHMNSSQTKLYALASNSIFFSFADGNSWNSINNGQTISNALDFTVDDKGIIYIVSDNKIYISKSDLTGKDDGNEYFPTAYELFQNYPNPFNPTTTIEFTLRSDTRTRLNIYNSLGQLITTLLNSYLLSGYHHVVFDGSNYPSGVYFYQLITNEYKSVKKLMLIK